MSTTSVVKPQIFYGWWIVFGGVLGNAINSGITFHALPAFLIPLSNSFGVSLTVMAAGLSLARIETAFLGPIEGYLVDKFGPRTMMLIGVPTMALGCLFISFCHSFTVFLIPFLSGLILGSSIGFASPLTTAVANWWQKKRGRAIGIMWLGHSLGSTAVPLYNIVIERLSWRWAFRIMTTTILVLGIPIALIMRHRPEQYGLLPDGVSQKEPEPSKNLPSQEMGFTDDSAPSSKTKDFTILEAIRTSSFWFFTISVSVRSAVTTALAINTFPLVQNLGGNSSEARFLFLLQGIFSAPGRLFLSWAGDFVNKRQIMAGCLLFLAVTLALMSVAPTVKQLTILWVPYAILWGGLSSLPNALRADLFGRENFATIQGATAPVSNLFGLLAPIFATWVFQTTGSYRIPLLVFSGFSLVSMVLILFAKQPPHGREKLNRNIGSTYTQNPH